MSSNENRKNKNSIARIKGPPVLVHANAIPFAPLRASFLNSNCSNWRGALLQFLVSSAEHGNPIPPAHICNLLIRDDEAHLDR